MMMIRRHLIKAFEVKPDTQKLLCSSACLGDTGMLCLQGTVLLLSKLDEFFENLEGENLQRGQMSQYCAFLAVTFVLFASFLIKDQFGKCSYSDHWFQLWLQL